MCTCVRIQAEDGAVVVGRTMEFGLELESLPAVLPRGMEGVSRGPSAEGKRWTADHGAVGISAFGDPHLLTDGINEAGLYAGDLYMPGFADYPPAEGSDPSTLLAPTDMLAFVLGTCATTAEAREAMAAVSVWPATVTALGDMTVPLHLVVHDASGDSAVFEWRDGEMIAFDNPLGVTTNAPHFDWHELNLRNYATLSAKNPEPVEVAGMRLAPFGQGTGMRGLPADGSPPSRFVRAAAYVATREPVPDGPAAEMEMLHLINDFDIPRGSVVAADGSAEWTEWTVIANLADLRYIVGSSADPTPRLIDLKKTDLEHGPRQGAMPSGTWLELEI